jgi:hypothetical protein
MKTKGVLKFLAWLDVYISTVADDLEVERVQSLVVFHIT